MKKRWREESKRKMERNKLSGENYNWFQNSQPLLELEGKLFVLPFRWCMDRGARSLWRKTQHSHLCSQAGFCRAGLCCCMLQLQTLLTVFQVGPMPSIATDIVFLSCISMYLTCLLLVLSLLLQSRLTVPIIFPKVTHTHQTPLLIHLLKACSV